MALLYVCQTINISFQNETAHFYWVSGQENKRTLSWFTLFGTTLQAHYPFTAHDEQWQITQIYPTAPYSSWFSHPMQKKKNFCFYKYNSALPLVFAGRKEVLKLMETPPHSVVVYFPSQIMQMEGAAKARFAGKYGFSSSLRLYQMHCFQQHL